MTLLRLACYFLFAEFVFSIFCIFYFDCGIIGDCENGLICYVHYIKFCQTFFLGSTYHGNIKERQPNHPIGQLNTFIVITLYYVCLYRYTSLLKENIEMVHLCVVYPAVDFFLILVSFIMISKVKRKSNKLIQNQKFTEYNQEAKIALADILYLP